MFFHTCGVNQFCIIVFTAVKPANNILFCIKLIQRPESSLRRHKLGLAKRCQLGMGDMGLTIYHDISCIYCDNDINDDNSGNPVSLEKSIIFPIFTPNRVL